MTGDAAGAMGGVWGLLLDAVPWWAVWAAVPTVGAVVFVILRVVMRRAVRSVRGGRRGDGRVRGQGGGGLAASAVEVKPVGAKGGRGGVGKRPRVGSAEVDAERSFLVLASRLGLSPDDKAVARSLASAAGVHPAVLLMSEPTFRRAVAVATRRSLHDPPEPARVLRLRRALFAPAERAA